MTEALEVLGLCTRFGCLPSQLEREDGGLRRMLALESIYLNARREASDE